jgi:hypothetical protein
LAADDPIRESAAVLEGRPECGKVVLQIALALGCRQHSIVHGHIEFLSLHPFLGGFLQGGRGLNLASERVRWDQPAAHFHVAPQGGNVPFLGAENRRVRLHLAESLDDGRVFGARGIFTFRPGQGMDQGISGGGLECGAAATAHTLRLCQGSQWTSRQADQEAS